MFALLRWLVGAAFAIIVLTFAVLNRESVTLHLTPIHDPINMPLYAVGLAFLALGYLFGSATLWIYQSKARREHRQNRRTLKTLQKKNEKKEKHNTSDTAHNHDDIKLLLTARKSQG